MKGKIKVDNTLEARLGNFYFKIKVDNTLEARLGNIYFKIKVDNTMEARLGNICFKIKVDNTQQKMISPPSPFPRMLFFILFSLKNFFFLILGRIKMENIYSWIFNDGQFLYIPA